jgi:L-alanine-DL-glutamate epimerase-like enolase superfamily enzyme
LVKVATLASAFEVPLVAHGHSLLGALHVAGSQSPATIPYVEYLIRNQPGKQNFHQVMVVPENGQVALPTEVGLAFSLDESKIERREAWRA